jgi:hypothetical protein
MAFNAIILGELIDRIIQLDKLLHRIASACKEKQGNGNYGWRHVL